MPLLEPVEHEASVHVLGEAWKAAIGAAASEVELIALARTYLASWMTSEIELLPLACWPGRIAAASDVSLIAFRLKREFCSAHVDSFALAHLQRMLAFFEALSERLYELQSDRFHSRAA